MNKLKDSKINDEWAERRIKLEMERQFLMSQQLENMSYFEKTIREVSKDKIAEIFESEDLKSSEAH